MTPKGSGLLAFATPTHLVTSDPEASDVGDVRESWSICSSLLDVFQSQHPRRTGLSLALAESRVLIMLNFA